MLAPVNLKMQSPVSTAPRLSPSRDFKTTKERFVANLLFVPVVRERHLTPLRELRRRELYRFVFPPDTLRARI